MKIFNLTKITTNRVNKRWEIQNLTSVTHFLNNTLNSRSLALSLSLSFYNNTYNKHS